MEKAFSKLHWYSAREDGQSSARPNKGTKLVDAVAGSNIMGNRKLTNEKVGLYLLKMSQASRIVVQGREARSGADAATCCAGRRVRHQSCQTFVPCVWDCGSIGAV